MPRNGSGSYSLPEPPFVPLTTISSTAMNSDLSDMASALTASLARDGQGGMTDVLPLNTAGFTYTNDTNTGMYRTGSDAQAIKCGGTDIVEVTTSGASVTGSLSATGAVKQNGFNLLPIGLGPLPWSGSNAPSGWVLAYGQSLSRTTYADLWAFAQAEIALGNTLYTNGNGTTTFTVPDLRGRQPFGRDNMGGTNANRLTSTYYGGNPSLIGSPGGTESKTLARDNLPNVAPTFTGISQSYPIDQHQIPFNTAGAALQGGGAAPSIILGTIGDLSVTITPSGTVSSLNGGVTQTAFSAIAPGIITTYIIFAGV